MGSILVVEDELPIRIILRKIFETSGHTVIEAEDGLLALNLIKETNRQFSLIVLDMRLPKMDGREFLYHLRRQLRSNTPVLVLTAHLDLCGEAKNFGADECLAKPFKPKQAVELAAHLIQHHTLSKRVATSFSFFDAFRDK